MAKSKPRMKLEELYFKGAKLIEDASISMYNTIVALCEKDIEKMEEFAQKTIHSEKKSDRIHDQIIDRLFSRETLVFSRQDRLYLISQMDEVVDKAEDVVRRATIYFPSTIPSQLVPRLIAVCERGKQIGTLLKNTILAIFKDFDEASHYIHLIESYRREAKQDDLAYLKKLYTLDLETRDFLYFDRLIHYIIKTIDTANTFADGIHRLIVKYQL
jgi:predicted phosphate transport protein (TIGR00153 family)